MKLKNETIPIPTKVQMLKALRLDRPDQKIYKVRRFDLQPDGLWIVSVVMKNKVWKDEIDNWGANIPFPVDKFIEIYANDNFFKWNGKLNEERRKHFQRIFL